MSTEIEESQIYPEHPSLLSLLPMDNGKAMRTAPENVRSIVDRPSFLFVITSI